MHDGLYEHDYRKWSRSCVHSSYFIFEMEKLREPGKLRIPPDPESSFSQYK